MSASKYDILIVGVGGQGVLLASEILAEVAMNHGLDVKKSEVHGMAQRGGVVSSHVRIAEKVFSPTIQYGQADVVIAFEKAEGLRALDWMKKDGVAIVSTTRIVPAVVASSKKFSYPDDPIADMKLKAGRVLDVAADEMAAELGNPRLVNTILLGALSNFTLFSTDLWIDVIKNRVKEKTVAVNIKAFEAGRRIQLQKAEV